MTPSLESNGGATFPVDSGWGQLVSCLTVSCATRGLDGLCHLPEAVRPDVFKQIFHHSYRGIWNRYPPSLVTGRSISGGQIFTLVTGRKFQGTCQICKGGTLCKKHFRLVTGPNSGDKIFRIVTGSKLASSRTLKGGYLFQLARYSY